MANNGNRNQFRDDEIVIMPHWGKKEEKWIKNIYPKIGGRLRLAHDANEQLSITTEIVRYDENLAVVRAVTTTLKGSFPGIGMASVERDYSIAPAILELAETRATLEVGPERTGEVTRHVPGKIPTSSRQVTPQEVSVLQAAMKPSSRSSLQQSSGLRDREHFVASVLKPLLDSGLLEMTIPEKPRSSKQKYRVTEEGRRMLTQMAEDS